MNTTEGLGRHLPNDIYALTPEQIDAIVMAAVRQAASDWHWGEGFDPGVFWVRISEYLQTGCWD